MENGPACITPRCPIRTTLELVGGKWRLLIIYQLAGGPVRFGDLKRSIPEISEKMLTQELKHLMESGLIHRNNHGEVPPRVDYILTDTGKSALRLVAEMRDFGLAYQQGLK